MNRIIRFAFSMLFLIVALLACKKPAPTVKDDFSKLTKMDNECRLVGVKDSSAWVNDVLNYHIDTALLTFTDKIYTGDTAAGIINISAPCPNPSNGFFFWKVSTTRECKLKLVCIDSVSDMLYYNAYRIEGGQPLEIAFDFRPNTAFHKDNNFRMYFAFYTAKDSVFYAGRGNFKIE